MKPNVRITKPNVPETDSEGVVTLMKDGLISVWLNARNTAPFQGVYRSEEVEFL